MKAHFALIHGIAKLFKRVSLDQSLVAINVFYENHLRFSKSSKHTHIYIYIERERERKRELEEIPLNGRGRKQP